MRYLSLPGDGDPRGADIGQKSFSSHLWPSELCALQRAAQREQHRWFYTCSCPAFSTLVLSVSVTLCYLVTSTSGTLTTKSGFQFTERLQTSKRSFLTFYEEVLISKMFTAGDRKCCEVFSQRRRLREPCFPIQGDFFLDGGVTFFFSEFSFNCANGQYNGLWRYGDKRSGPETEPMCVEFQA